MSGATPFNSPALQTLLQPMVEPIRNITVCQNGEAEDLILHLCVIFGLSQTGTSAIGVLTFPTPIRRKKTILSLSWSIPEPEDALRGHRSQHLDDK